MATLLQVIKEAEFIKKLYDENPLTNTYNVIVYSPPKVGKTYLLRTVRFPLHIDSFDPGGTEVLRDLIEQGKIIVDNSFEKEDPYSPSAFRRWQDAFNKRIEVGYFDYMASYAIDSMTTWQQTIMNEVIRQAAKAHPKKRSVGQQPFEQDWLPQMTYIENYMRKFLSIPCDCFLLGHDELPTRRDEEGNEVAKGDRSIMTTGKLRTRIPAIFSEVYFLRIKNFQTGERVLLTQPEYMLTAGTRLGSGGKLNKEEKPDFKAILRKVGKDASDKPLMKDLITKEQQK